MSELFVAVHFSVAANEESRKREQEKGSRGKGGERGSGARARHIFFMFTADFAAYFQGIFGIFGVLATFYDCLTV